MFNLFKKSEFEIISQKIKNKKYTTCLIGLKKKKI